MTAAVKIKQQIMKLNVAQSLVIERIDITTNK